MGVSSIQSGSGVYGISGSQERKKQAASTTESRNSGSDTATISGEAVAKYQAMKKDDVNLDNKGAPAKSFSLSDMGTSMFSMMLESLFLAELDEAQRVSSSATTGNGETSDAAPQSGQERVGGSSLFNDTEKVAELKKIMNDVVSGKVELSDLPQAMAKAMALGGGGGTPAMATKTTNSGHASAQKEDSNSTN